MSESGRQGGCKGGGDQRQLEQSSAKLKSGTGERSYDKRKQPHQFQLERRPETARAELLQTQVGYGWRIMRQEELAISERPGVVIILFGGLLQVVLRITVPLPSHFLLPPVYHGACTHESSGFFYPPISASTSTPTPSPLPQLQLPSHPVFLFLFLTARILYLFCMSTKSGCECRVADLYNTRCLLYVDGKFAGIFCPVFVVLLETAGAVYQGVRPPNDRFSVV